MKDIPLSIRELEATDADAYLELFSEPSVAQYDDFTPITAADLPEFHRRLGLPLEELKEKEYAVALKPENRLVGILTLAKKRRYYYLGYHFIPRFQGKGLATRALRLFLPTLDPDILSRLRLAIHPQNSPSLAIAAKLGFKKTTTYYKKHEKELIFSLPG